MIISATEARLIRCAISSALANEESYLDAWSNGTNKDALRVQRRTRGLIKRLRTLDRKIAERQRGSSNAAPRA